MSYTDDPRDFSNVGGRPRQGYTDELSAREKRKPGFPSPTPVNPDPEPLPDVRPPRFGGQGTPPPTSRGPVIPAPRQGQQAPHFSPPPESGAQGGAPSRPAPGQRSFTTPPSQYQGTPAPQPQQAPPPRQAPPPQQQTPAAPSSQAHQQRPQAKASPAPEQPAQEPSMAIRLPQVNQVPAPAPEVGTSIPPAKGKAPAKGKGVTGDASASTGAAGAPSRKSKISLIDPEPAEAQVPVNEGREVRARTGVTAPATRERPVEPVREEENKSVGSVAFPQPGPSPQVGSEILMNTENLVKIYDGRTVVNGVNINVRKGEIVGLLGPNGAGKTTSFYMIVGLVPPNGGTVMFNGMDVTRLPMYKRARLGMGYLPQEESIFRKLTVEENIMAVMQTMKYSRKERRERCDELLERFSITHIRNNVAMTCSGGEKRRVTIARSLVPNPSLIMLDEPFSGVDPIAVNEIQSIVEDLRKSGLAILITDHNARQTLELVDRAYLIYEGKVLREGPKEFLINDPVSRELYLGDRFKM